jgi:hypothetical protein
MDWSRGCGAEDTANILGQPGPPAVTCACTKVPAEQDKAAGDVAARETNRAAVQDSAGAEKARERRRRKRSQQWNLRERRWPSDRGQPVPPQAALKQQGGNRGGGEENWPASLVSQHRGTTGLTGSATTDAVPVHSAGRGAARPAQGVWCPAAARAETAEKAIRAITPSHGLVT